MIYWIRGTMNKVLGVILNAITPKGRMNSIVFNYKLQNFLNVK
jgi:hypothetical protein